MPQILRRVVGTGMALGLGAFFLTSALAAQSPIGDPFLVNPPAIDENGLQSQTLLADGDLLVVWENELTLDAPPASIVGRRFSLHHPPGALMQLARGLGGLFNPLVAPRGDDGFLFTFIRDEVDASSFGCFAVAFGGDGRPLGPEVEYASNVGCGEGLISLADGTYATSWLRESSPALPRLRVYRMFARLSAMGRLASRPRRINPHPLQRSLSANSASLGGNRNGDMTLIWNGSPAFARSFSAFGGPLPPLFFVSFTDSTSSDVAVTPNGTRIFTGLNHPPGDSNYVAFQRFAADGSPLGSVRPAQTLRHALFGVPKIAADRFGNFAIAWGSQPGIFCDPLEVRLFRADGTPVGKELATSLAAADACEGSPQVSFGTDGTFAVSWVDPLGVSVAWFSASPGDEPCLTRGGRLLCDTGRTGGLPEIDQPDDPDASAASDALFLADFDGDGRADPCYHSGTTFSCDLGHRGRGPTASVDFGLASDRPLMGDVDGDGRADACVRRGDLLACDTLHTGGAPGFTEHFGDPAGDPDAIPLLGDLDGDGRADLCLFKDGVFSCDLGHHGGAPDLVIRFGQVGDLPVLGDYDGDGRADPCLLRGRTLRCDLRHDGGTAEAILRLAVHPGDGIVMGNLDGL